MHRIACCCCLALLCSACTPDASRKAAQKDWGAALVEHFLVTDDRVPLLSTPESGGVVLERLPIGALIRGLHAVSDKKYEMELGGRLWLEPFYRISAPSGQQGWVYGGGLLRVFSSIDSADLDGTHLEQFARELSGIGDRTPEQAIQAGALAVRMFGQANSATADAASLLLEHYLKRMLAGEALYRYVEDATWITEPVIRAISTGQFDMQAHAQSKQLALAGFTLAAAEGLVYPEIDHQHLRKLFEGRLSASTDRYYTLQAAETDALRGVESPSLASIADRAAVWEQFNRENPYFMQREAAAFNERYLIHSVTHGEPGTFVFDPETSALAPGFREAWLYTLKQYPDTRLAQYAGRMLTACEASGWKASPQVDAEMAAITRELMPD
jgi:hypothetical protein